MQCLRINQLVNQSHSRYADSQTSTRHSECRVDAVGSLFQSNVISSMWSSSCEPPLGEPHSASLLPPLSANPQSPRPSPLSLSLSLLLNSNPQTPYIGKSKTENRTADPRRWEDSCQRTTLACISRSDMLSALLWLLCSMHFRFTVSVTVFLCLSVLLCDVFVRYLRQRWGGCEGGLCRDSGATPQRCFSSPRFSFFFFSLLFVRLSSFRSLRIVVVPFLFVVVLLDNLVSSSSRLRLG